ncbi:hypothetical protein H2O64_03270 [Kordia sp. YSTF-M3]|uniref:DUF4468 domain-containing protein n=1 Tax=Kordia aestuariivivens TaxID=2759037 RepID=A0ABR7Q587_9FLAO|nr:hypothetical protein [Kordia aestuariivivens]MBC8753673.1 hypothetical protein [Kordia aestuariivivens]
METIKIVLFVLGLFFGIETSTVIAEKTIVIVSPKTKTIVIQHENLLAIYPTEKDSLSIAKEFASIYTKKDSWNTHLDTFTEKYITYNATEKGVLSTKITLKYTKLEDLKVFAIDTNPEGKFSIINIPQWYIATENGKLNGNYWNFDADKKFSFSLSPVKNVPETYTIHKTMLHKVWQELTKE